jgi:hypothetical protein
MLVGKLVGSISGVLTLIGRLPKNLIKLFISSDNKITISSDNYIEGVK